MNHATNIATELEKLIELHESGHLSDREFKSAKARLCSTRREGGISRLIKWLFIIFAWIPITLGIMMAIVECERDAARYPVALYKTSEPNVLSGTGFKLGYELETDKRLTGWVENTGSRPVSRVYLVVDYYVGETNVHTSNHRLIGNLELFPGQQRKIAISLELPSSEYDSITAYIDR